MSTSPTTGHADKPADPSLHSATQAPEELEGLKIVVLESAELATRSANMATNAGADLKAATKHLDTTLAIQKKADHHFVCGSWRPHAGGRYCVCSHDS